MQLLIAVVKTPKNIQESAGQRAQATFEDGTIPSGPDRGLNLKIAPGLELSAINFSQ